jgi:hypothetical protein
MKMRALARTSGLIDRVHKGKMPWEAVREAVFTS